MVPTGSAYAGALPGRDYAYTAALSYPEWAWEFLRRNQAFCRQLDLFAGHVQLHRPIANATVARVDPDAPSLQPWGLRFRELTGQRPAGRQSRMGSRHLPVRHSGHRDPNDASHRRRLSSSHAC